MADISKFLEREKDKNDILSLHVKHHNLELNILFISDRKTFLFAVKGKNISWQPPCEDNWLKEFVPKDVFDKIKYLYADKDDWSNKNLFNKIANILNANEKINRDTETNKNKYLKVLKQTKTVDQRYGDEGSKPYFWHFRKAKPTEQNLEKIKVNLGQKVYNICKDNCITVIWTDDTRKNKYYPLQELIGLSNSASKDIKEWKLVPYSISSDITVELFYDAEEDTYMLDLQGISALFKKDKSNISRHIKNIFNDEELDKNSVVAKNATTGKDGKTYIIEYYDLDMIISVGYRVNSVIATKFRKWATQTLNQHITQGYTINKSRVENDPKLLLEIVTGLNEMSNKQLNNDDTLELIKTFSYTWFSLQSYDEQKFPKTHSNIDIELSVEKLYKDLANLKDSLISKKEATILFGQEKSKGSLDSIFKNVFQNVFGQELYPSIEEKAAHILYFVVKNHPFNDGNKRSGAYAFIWLLKSFNYSHRITPETLATLTILIAESSPNDKDKMIGMVLLLLAGGR